MDFFTNLANVVKGLFPILSGIASVFFPEVTIAPKILNALPGLVGAAEQIFGAGEGELKKEYVMTAAEGIVGIMADVSTGGQKETWEKIAPLTSTMVDAIVAGTNSVGAVVDNNAFIING